MSPLMDLQEFEDKNGEDNHGRDAAAEKEHGIKPGDRVKDKSGMNHKVAQVKGNNLKTDQGAGLNAMSVSKIN